MAQDISEFEYQLSVEVNQLNLKDGVATQYKFLKMQEFRTKLREDFLRNRSY
jgi:hypothetical protein